MGTIRVGRNAWRKFTPGIVESKKSVADRIGDEERKRLVEGIKQMPKEKWVSALRSVGLDAEADECERSLAEEHLVEMRQQARASRLEEILSMPEGERLPLLIAEGFEEVAREQSERMAVESKQDASPVVSDVSDGLIEVEGVKPRRRGRRPKSEKK